MARNYHAANRGYCKARNCFNQLDHVGDGNQSAYTTFIANCLQEIEENTVQGKDKWYVDSGASAHMCNDRHMFYIIKESKPLPSVSFGDG